MRRLLLISAASALLATPALAQDDAIDEAAPAAQDETLRDTTGDGSLETLKNGYTDEHAYVGATVFSEGEAIGEIERVHFSGDAIDRLVIETGGVADLGGREVEVPLADGTLTYMLNLTRAEVHDLPDFDEADASDFPLSDNPLEDLDDDASAD